MKNPKDLPWTVKTGEDVVAYVAALRDAIWIAGRVSGTVTRAGHKGVLWDVAKERIGMAGLDVAGVLEFLQQAEEIVDNRIEIEEQKAEIRAKYKKDLAALVQPKA